MLSESAINRDSVLILEVFNNQVQQIFFLLVTSYINVSFLYIGLKLSMISTRLTTIVQVKSSMNIDNILLLKCNYGFEIRLS
jgi:hypothetical protein